MRKKIVAGNWKMNLHLEEGNALFEKIVNEIPKKENVEVIVFPPAFMVPTFVNKRKDIHVGAQNFYPADKGAFTGEISVEQFKNLGVTHLLIGHSERRMYFSESNEFLKKKVDVAIEKDLLPVFCCGEPIEIRESGKELEFVKNQLQESLFHLTKENMLKVVIAYEPIWAIGTGLTATSAQAEEMHKNIRAWLTEKYGIEVSNEISILYGGSCNAANAKELFECPNVDGGLIGGASLDADAFSKIIEAR